ncbi:unnamed protein product [Hermetia illucens]|uniref:SERTA domain-containing protein n=1 Tax=Hermetia illucens TaxID=343691 RepID=A0A7R8UT98_HERIL|nr:uncharacterized protein DDB_G0271670 [Hermetia illucens]CAD7086654.1 unnamed protein product [Hermetia illucens]
MTLPTTSPLNGNDDDSDMFGPPRSSPVAYHHQRSRVPMISPKLRQREERKRILQLCAHKLERIKDSEANLRRSVCINNTYSRLTDEVRREKQSRYLANLPKSDTKPETAHDNMYSPYNHNYDDQMELRNESYHKINHHSPHHHSLQESFNNNNLHSSSNNNNQKNKLSPMSLPTTPSTSSQNSATMMSSSVGSGHCGGGGDSGGSSAHSTTNSSIDNRHQCIYSSPASLTSCSLSTTTSSASLTSSSIGSTTCSSSTLSTTSSSSTSSISSSLSSSSVDTDLEILDRELSAINASMPLIDPEITQGAEQLEKAVSSRKRSRTEEENDRLVREALSQFYLPTQRVISAIDDFPPDIKRTKLCSGALGSLGGTSTIADLDLDLGLDMSSHHHHHHHHQNQKEFEVIMDALRLSTSSPTPSAQDSCGQAAMMSESGVFHNLVVTSLET